MKNPMNAMRIIFLIPVLMWLAGSVAHAEFIGINIGASQWTPALSGSVNSENNESIDLVDDLGIDNPSKSSMVLILEHPLSALPNIRYQGIRLDSSGITTPGSDLSFNGETFSSGDPVKSSFDLSHDDIVLYYQVLKSRVNLDLGVDLKRFDGEVSLSGDTRSSSVDVDEMIPLLYLSARYKLPNSGFYLGANINANIIDLGLSDSSAEDSTIMLGYDTGNGIGVEGGYKRFSLELNDVNSLDTDLRYDGLYLNGYFNF